ncbi:MULTISPECIES: hypothetical protein [unclassified Mesorhizobium]|uniref:hypothetical protein n=1 Tax=unclassified Mesorhizobium TaxID=325217 RepID=UPI00313DD87E
MSFIATVMDDKKVKLRVASMPHADKFQLHIYAALAEQERSSSRSGRGRRWQRPRQEGRSSAVFDLALWFGPRQSRRRPKPTPRS